MEFKARALFSSHVAPAALAASAKTGRANAMARVQRHLLVLCEMAPRVPVARNPLRRSYVVYVQDLL